METGSVSKIRLKVGSVEVEFEGSEDYMKEQLPSLIELLCSNATVESSGEEETVGAADELPPNENASKSKIQMTTNTISSKLGVKSGSDLIIAACAHLCLVKGHETFTRKNILAEMQTASNFYVKSYGKNLSRYLKTVVGDEKLIERSKDTYALSAAEKSRLESRLSDS